MESSTHKVKYHGTGGSLFGLVLKNLLLTIVTLGIYSFWAKNNVREFHYGHTELGDERFAYHGTGKELFLGAAKAMLIFFTLGVVLAVVMPQVIKLAGGSPIVPMVFMGGFYLFIFLVVIYAINGARRYRLSRSSWRGIRFAFHGRWQEFLGLVVSGTLLSIVTLGFYMPYFQNRARAFFVNNAAFGSEPFVYNGEGRHLIGNYVKAVLLTIPTLGLYWVWYAAFRHRYFWNHTRIAGARFSSTVEGGELLKLQLTNMLLVVFTLGIGMPWAAVRTQAFWADNMRLHGAPDWATITQRAQTASATSEGLAEGLDVDVGMGM